MNRIRTILIFVFMLAAPALVAQEATPRFFIERIEVRHAKRVSTDVIVAESGLRANQEYAESELRDAALRLNRLPFLLSADFSLEKGSERGRHVLVITVNETKPFFFLLDARPIFERDAQTRPDYSDTLASENDLFLGFRWFVGRRGAFHVGLQTAEDSRDYTTGYSAIAVGYTQYDLFGTRAFATLNLKRPLVESDPSITPQVVLGVPLSLNQTLTMQYDETRAGTLRTRRQLSERVLTAKWSYNTTNEPVLPTTGVVISAGPVLTWTDRSGYFYTVLPDTGSLNIEPYVDHLRTYGLEAHAARYFELDERYSVSAAVDAAAAKVNRHSSIPELLSYDWRYGAVQGGISRSFWTREERAGGGDNRLELTLRAASRSHEYPYYGYRNSDVLQSTLSWVRRTSWGTLRLGAGYAW